MRHTLMFITLIGIIIWSGCITCNQEESKIESQNAGIVDNDAVNGDLTKRGSHQGPTANHLCGLSLVSSHESSKCKECKAFLDSLKNAEPVRSADVNQQGSHQGPNGYAAPDWRKIPNSSFNCPVYEANPKPPHDRLQCHHCVTKLNSWGYKFLVPAK